MINTNQQYNLSVYLIDSNGNEFPIESQNVISLTITESVIEILPKFDMIINNAGTFTESIPLTDKTMVRFQLDSIYKFNDNIQDGSKYINSTFIISSYFAIADPAGNKFYTYNISGYLAYPSVAVKFSAYKGSSDEVFKYISNNTGFTADIRVKGNESISWIQNNNALNFLYHVSERAFIPNDGVFVYATLDNKLVYTSLYTEWAKGANKTAKYNTDIITVLNPSINIVYNGYTMANNTSLYNNALTYGYQYIYHDGDSIVTPTVKATESMVSLYNRNINIPSNAITNFDDYGLIIDDRFKDTIFKGKIQNDYFKYLLFSNTVELNINNSSDVKLFEKVSLELRSMITPNTISEPYSGDYVIGCITHSITQNIPYSKKIILCRSGMNNYDNVYVKDVI